MSWCWIENREIQLNREVESRAKEIARILDPVPENELDETKLRSAELGPPQPKPLPPGYGEKPNL